MCLRHRRWRNIPDLLFHLRFEPHCGGPDTKETRPGDVQSRKGNSNSREGEQTVSKRRCCHGFYFYPRFNQRAAFCSQTLSCLACLLSDAPSALIIIRALILRAPAAAERRKTMFWKVLIKLLMFYFLSHLRLVNRRAAARSSKRRRLSVSPDFLLPLHTGAALPVWGPDRDDIRSS